VKNLFYKTICICISFSFVYADDCLSEKSTYCLLKNHPHHIYLGPEAFWCDLSIHIKNCKINGKKGFLGIRAGYEYLKPKAFYVGVDLLSAGSNKGFDGESAEYYCQNSSNAGFGNFEIRLGYAFARENLILTPFLGVGGYALGNNGPCFHFHESMVYYAAGMRSVVELNHFFNLGLNWKIFRIDDAERKIEYLLREYAEFDNTWGCEIGVPFIWRLGSSKRWDIQLEPYFLKLAFSELQNIYGTRLLFGYRI